jgi:VCBS repeat-containing protein
VAPFDADDVDHDDDSSTLLYTADVSGFTGTKSVTVGTSPTSTPPNGFFKFDPGTDFVSLAAGATMNVVFPYTATDSHMASATASVTVVVTGVNEAPTAAPVAIQAVEDGPAVAGTFLGGDVDTDDSQATLTYSFIGGLPANSGTLVNNNNGTFSFSPGTSFQDLAEGATRVLTFRYVAKDRHGAISPTATGTITVTGKNDAPAVAGLSLITGENQTLTASFSGTDVDAGAVLSFATNPLQGGGSLTNNGNGTFTFNPGTTFDHLASGTNATVTFTYLASDGMAQSALATVTITVNGVNDAPTAQDVSVAAVEDGPIVTAQFIGNDVDDNEATSLSYTITSSPAGGNVIHSGGQTFAFDPGPDFQELAVNGALVLTFTYQVRDRFGLASPTDGTVNVTVTGRNDAPVVSNISGLVAVENGPAITGNFVAQDVDSDETGAGITFSVVSQPTEGTVTPTVTAAGNTLFTFDPGQAFQDLSVGQSRQVTFTYRAADTHAGVSQLGTATITVNGANDAPVSQNITGVMAVEDGSPVNITLRATDIDSDETGSTLVYAIKTPPPTGSGTVSVSGVPGNAIAVFNPGNDFQDLAVGQTRSVTFTYSAADQQSLEGNTAVVTVVVTGVNDAPVAQTQTLSGVNEDGPAQLGSFVATDADSDGAASGFIYSILAQPAQGRVTVSGTPGDASFSFDPNGDFNDLSLNATRNVTFTYQVRDTHNGVGTATVTVTVNGANDQPTASTVNVTANENGIPVTRAFAGDDIDSDDSQQTLTYQFTSSLTSTQGTIVTDPGNLRQFIYDPGTSFQELSLNEIGSAQVTYTATDSHNSTSVAGTITISVTGANDAPTTTPLSFNVGEGGSLTQFFAGDDVDNDDSFATLQFTLVNLPPASAGTVTNLGGGRFTFVPGSSFESLAMGNHGTTSFTYRARDRHGVASNDSTVTINVDGVNDRPVVQNLNIAAVEDGAPVSGAFVGDDIDTDDTPATIAFQITTQPSEGSASNSGGNTFTFNPGTAFQDLGINETRTVTFTYTATDSHAATSSPGTVTVTVSGVNDAPIARDDHASTLEGQIQTINVIGPDSGGQDTDPDGDPLTIASHQPTSTKGASISLSASSILTYNPTTSATLNGLAAGVITTDTFTYMVSDGRGGTATATVTVTVTGVNNAPLAVSDNFTAAANAVLNVAAPGVLGNDTDPDPGTTLGVASMAAISLRGATITADGNGGFTYDPRLVEGFRLLNANESLNDTFTYIASDGSLTSNVATVTVTVNGVNDTPIANPESYSTAEETTLQVSAFAGVLANDRDIENEPLGVTLVTGVAHGTLNLSGNGAFTYTPVLNFNGNETFVYRVSDGNSSADATATIVVTAVNDAPVAVADQYSMSQGATLQVAALDGVLKNDSDVDDAKSTLQALARSLPTNGSVTLLADGSFTYTPTPDFAGVSTFTYQAVDPSGARSALTTVQITVSGGNVVTWHNTTRPFDVNNDGSVTPIDALQIINDLNSNGSRQLPTLQGGPPFVDTNNDGFVTPIDVLLVVNDINSKTGSPEGEGAQLADSDNSSASSPITVLAAADAGTLIDLPSARPQQLSSPMFKVEGGLISPIGTTSATVKRVDAMAEPARRLESRAGGWSDLLTELASVHRSSSPIDSVLATLDGDSDDLLDDVLNDLF